MFCHILRTIEDISDDKLTMKEWKFSLRDVAEDGPDNNKVKLVWWLESYFVFERTTPRHKFKMFADVPQYARLSFNRPRGVVLMKDMPEIPTDVWNLLNISTLTRNELFVE